MRETTKNALLCGAARGLGEIISRKFLNEGWNVIILDLTLPQRPPEPNVFHYQCDATDFASTERCLNKIVEKFQTIDALVNCIRYRRSAGQAIHFAEEWKSAIDVGLHTYFHLSSVICELMKAANHPCSIINLSSVTSELVTLKESISYHVAKAAVNQMTRYLALQYGPQSIRVNSILPGLISHHQSEKGSSDSNASLYAKYAQYVPLRRSGSPQEVADLTFFLASEHSSFITGQTIVIDGGLSICEHLGMVDVS